MNMKTGISGALCAMAMIAAQAVGATAGGSALEDLMRQAPDALESVSFQVPTPQKISAVPANPVFDLEAPVKWEIIPLDPSKSVPEVMPSYSKEEFCKNSQDPDYFKKLILDQKNRLSFRNSGGLFNGGVCWWHSMLDQRQVYLTVFRPDLPKPSQEQVEEIYLKYFWGNSVAEIPGYSNFYEFSLNWHRFLQKKLNEWQVSDGILGSWLNGLAGASEVSAEELKGRMDRLYKEVNGNKKIVWQKLQIPGIVAHAWLVVNMERTDSGYDMTVLDSNFSRPYRVGYENGDTSTDTLAYPNFVAYTQRLGDLKKIRRAQEAYCSSN